ncbi:hypothetical protein [Phormidesmis priestleyi]|nr:hypothetical protein [Phormidesmis priestleyi]
MEFNGTLFYRTNEWKYRIRGMTQDNTELEVVAKLGLNGNLVIITVYLL